MWNAQGKKKGRKEGRKEGRATGGKMDRSCGHRISFLSITAAVCILYRHTGKGSDAVSMVTKAEFTF